MERMKIWKIALLVEDVEAAEELYSNVLGMEVIQRFPSGAIFLDAGDVKLEIIPKKLFEGDDRLGVPGVHHLSFKVDDIVKTFQELKGKGVRFIKEPFELRKGLMLGFFDGLNKVNLQLFNQKQ